MNLNIFIPILIASLTTTLVIGQEAGPMPPSPCLIYDYQVDSAGVFLGLMPSTTRRVVAHKLYRKKQNTNNWKLIQTYDKDVPQVFLDNTLASNGRYTYKWIAEDDLGQQSNDEHSKLNVTAFDLRMYYRPTITLTNVENGIEINVSNDIPGEDYRVQIIKSIDNNNYKTLTILKQGLVFIDQEKVGSNNETIKYKAKILYKDGKRSKYGKEVTL